MTFDKKAWMRVYMRAYRRGKRRKPRPGYFDKKAWSRPYMREYMRRVRARQKLERERDEAVNAAIARLSNKRACRRFVRQRSAGPQRSNHGRHAACA